MAIKINNLISKTVVFSLIIVFLLFFRFVSADILSINSGGSNQLVMNPNNYLEGFFLWADRFPVAANLILSSSAGHNSTIENLTITYTSSDADHDAITNITDWRLNTKSIAVLNMPFNKRVFTTTTGAVRDYSSFANNGTLGGGVSTYSPTWNFSGQVGGAFVFDGVDDYIDCGNDASLRINDFISVGAWVKFKSFQNSAHNFIVSRGVRSPWLFGQYVSGKLHVALTWSDDSYQDYHVGNLQLNTWHYVMFTFNSTSANTRIYQDGILIGDYIKSGNEGLSLKLTSTPVKISEPINGHTFNGSIDEVIIFNRTLSPQEVYELYSAGLAHHELEKIDSQELAKGDVWRVALTPNDVYNDGVTIFSNNLTIINLPPYDPTNVKLVSLNGRNESNTDLNCSAYISDGDSNSLTVFLRWYKNNILNFTQQFDSQNNNTLFWTLLGHNNLTLGDVWKCSARTYDSTDYSNWVDSNNLTIIDITKPNITIVSPNSIYNYTTLDVDFNISISENENISWCGYSLNQTANKTMNRFNDGYFWYEPQNLVPGTHNVTFWCNDTSGNFGTNSTNFTIAVESAISISLSPALSWSVNWSLLTLPASDLGATGNNYRNSTDYYINISTNGGVSADIYVRADGDLRDAGMDILKLANETYAANLTNGSVPNLDRINMTTSYVLIGDNLANSSVIYMKFYLNAPAGQPAGTYTNNLDFKAVMHGQTP